MLMFKESLNPISGILISIILISFIRIFQLLQRLKIQNICRSSSASFDRHKHPKINSNSIVKILLRRQNQLLTESFKEITEEDEVVILLVYVLDKLVQTMAPQSLQISKIYMSVEKLKVLTGMGQNLTNESRSMPLLILECILIISNISQIRFISSVLTINQKKFLIRHLIRIIITYNYLRFTISFHYCVAASHLACVVYCFQYFPLR